MFFPLGVLFWAILPLIAIFLALWALSVARGRGGQATGDRLQILEARLRELTERIWHLEQLPRPRPEAEAPEPDQEITPGRLVMEPGLAADSVPSEELPHERAVEPEPAIPTPASSSLDLEQRIGAKWTTWVGVVALLFALSFFLRWAFENNLITPELRRGPSRPPPREAFAADGPFSSACQYMILIPSVHHR